MKKEKREMLSAFFMHLRSIATQYDTFFDSLTETPQTIRYVLSILICCVINMMFLCSFVIFALALIYRSSEEIIFSGIISLSLYVVQKLILFYAYFKFKRAYKEGSINLDPWRFKP